MGFALDAMKDDPVARRESGVYELIDKHYNARGLKLIGVFSSASGYHFLLREPIGADGALKGRKIRASATYHDMVEQLQGAVVSLPASEIYSALERRVVDGAAWPVFGAMESRWYEVSEYMTRPTFGVTNGGAQYHVPAGRAGRCDLHTVDQVGCARIQGNGAEYANDWRVHGADPGLDGGDRSRLRSRAIS